MDCRAPRWDQESIEKAMTAEWGPYPECEGALQVRVVVYEEYPATGTRTRVYPHGDPTCRTMAGRVERALVAAGVIASSTQVVDFSVVKAWAQADGVTVHVGRP